MIFPIYTNSWRIRIQLINLTSIPHLVFQVQKENGERLQAFHTANVIILKWIFCVLPLQIFFLTEKNIVAAAADIMKSEYAFILC